MTKISKRVGILMMALVLALCTAVGVSASDTGYTGVLALPSWVPPYVPAHTFNIVDNETGVDISADGSNYIYEIPILDDISVTVNGVTRTGTVTGAVAYDANAGYGVSFANNVLTVTTSNAYSNVDVDITFSVVWDDDIEHVNTTTANLTIEADA
jgi:hypothetical protein